MSGLLRRARGMNLDLFCLTDRLYFDDPLRHESRPEQRDYAVGPVPTGWRQIVQREWVHLVPDDWHGPRQGWKIHVSALPGHAEQALTRTAAFCLQHAVMFKHLRSEAVLLTTSAKYAPRSSSGKFITIYPRDTDQLFEVLDGLDAELAGPGAPYILSNLRWQRGPLYVRYGGFATRHCTGPDGAQVLAVESPDGLLVPDERLPYFSVPEWVELPPRLAAMTENDAGGLGSCDFRFESAVHFSNGGGVYRGSRIRDGRPVVLKEARPHAGLDSEGLDAVARLEREHAAYEALGHLDGLPDLLERFALWEHSYLAVALVDGLPLQRWQAANHPAVRSDTGRAEREAYAAAALDILTRTQQILASVHAEGWVHGDLHPGNLIVADTGEVHLLDLEQAKPADDPRLAGLGCPGFVRPGRGSTRLGIDDDRYALGVLALWIFLPLSPVISFDPTKAAQHLSWVQSRFDLPGWWLELVRDTYGEALDTRGGRGPVTVSAQVRAIAASVTPEREDRLFPGDVLQVLDNGVQFAAGAAGVLWALAELGHDVDPRLVAWLEDHSPRVSRPGFFDGTAGVAAALVKVGSADRGLALLTQAADTALDRPDPTVYSGRAGVGLTLLSHAALLPCAVEQATRLADGIWDLAPPAAPTSTHVAAGFVDGWSGVALFLARLARATGSSELAERARECVRRDVAACTLGPDGSLLVNEQQKLLPYLACGSAGIALAAAELAAAGWESLEPDELTGLVRGLSPELVVEPGLFDGRAGLILALHWLQDTQLADTAAILQRHLEALPWQVVRAGDGQAVLGRGLRRLSMDVATGNAGVAAVLAAVADGTAALPILSGAPLTQTDLGARLQPVGPQFSLAGRV